MKFPAVFLCLAATAWAVEPQRRDAPATTASTESGFDVASLSSQLEHLTANATSGANFANISPPPKSLIGEIISAVPMTVLWELIDQESRRSLASEFSAGTTPGWYSSLPPDVKSYMSVVRSQVKAGALTATPTPTGTGTTASASQTGTGSGTATETGAGSSSTSSGMAAQPTAVTAVVGALGVLGLALAL